MNVDERHFQQSIVGLECVASRWNVWVSLDIDEIPRRERKLTKRHPTKHRHCHRGTGLPRSMLTIHVPPETLPAVYSMRRVFGKPVEGLGVLER